jgi:anti-sigma-K factor RskA
MMTCMTADELAGAYALGALEPEEEQAVAEHLRSCEREHAELRRATEAAAMLAAAIDPVEAPSSLRDRILATADMTPQDHRLPTAGAAGQAEPVEPPRESSRGWWQVAPLATGLAAVALAAAVGLGAWNLSLSQQLADREATLRSIAAADAAFPVSGSGGTGWILQTADRAVFLAEELAELPADRIYELWLIDPDGSPTAVGVIEQTAGLTIVELERSLDAATAFAVTIEAERVESPTSDPVLIAPLGS